MELLPFLFSLFFVTAFSSSPRYQTLNTLPLQKSPLHESRGQEDLAWTVDPDTLSDDDSPTSSLRFTLSHRDHLFPSNSTPERLLRHRLDRDAARVASLAAGRPPASFSGQVISGLAQGSGEYFTRIGIGTPLTYAYMVLDTGSDVVWIQCAPCRRCYSQTGPVFDPRNSSSFSGVPCGSQLCHRLDVGSCDTRRGSCLYQVSYGDGSVTTGDFSTETLTFSSGTRVGRIAFGCGHDNEGLFVAAAGLLGLGRGRLSFPSQAGRRFGRQFSYCLVDRTSSLAPTRKSSTVEFGEPAGPVAGMVFTPMLTNPKMDTFYYVEMMGFSVGGARVPGVLASDLRLDPATGSGGVIVDSGTSVTRLTRSAYAALRDAFRSAATGLKPAAGYSLFDTCFDLKGKTEVKVPTVAMHFGGANVSLPAANYLIPVDSSGLFCFAFAGTDSGTSIIGNIQQQGFRVVFDNAGQRIGFSPRSC